MKTEPTDTLWACIDCTMIEVNGESNPEWTEEEEAAHLEAMDNEAEGIVHYTPGAMFGEGSCEHTQEDWETDSEAHAIECEEREFSWSSCDLCGSHLGGSRHAFTGWVEVADAVA